MKEDRQDDTEREDVSSDGPSLDDVRIESDAMEVVPIALEQVAEAARHRIAPLRAAKIRPSEPVEALAAASIGAAERIGPLRDVRPLGPEAPPEEPVPGVEDALPAPRAIEPSFRRADRPVESAPSRRPSPDGPARPDHAERRAERAQHDGAEHRARRVPRGDGRLPMDARPPIPPTVRLGLPIRRLSGRIRPPVGLHVPDVSAERRERIIPEPMRAPARRAADEPRAATARDAGPHRQTDRARALPNVRALMREVPSPRVVEVLRANGVPVVGPISASVTNVERAAVQGRPHLPTRTKTLERIVRAGGAALRTRDGLNRATPPRLPGTKPGTETGAETRTVVHVDRVEIHVDQIADIQDIEAFDRMLGDALAFERLRLGA